MSPKALIAGAVAVAAIGGLLALPEVSREQRAAPAPLELTDRDERGDRAAERKSDRDKHDRKERPKPRPKAAAPSPAPATAPAPVPPPAPAPVPEPEPAPVPPPPTPVPDDDDDDGGDDASGDDT